MKIEIPELNSQWFSLDSIEGILIVIFMIFIMIHSSKRVVNMIFGLLAVIVGVQVLFILGQTDLNNYVPIAKFFHHDVFGAIAQLMPGTKAAQILMMISQFMTDLIGSFIGFIYETTMGLLHQVGNIGQ